MFAKIGALLGVLALPFLCLNCLNMHSVPIQESLKAYTATTLSSAGIKGVTVDADGRDMVLNGTVETEAIRTQAGTVAMALPGVRTVKNQLTVVPPGLSVEGVQSKLNEILLRKKIEFQTGRDVILPTSLPVLEEALQVLNQAPQLSITINGHTDSAGLASANKDLSARRAKAVAAWFAGHGVAASRLSSAGYGSEKPIDTNATEAGKAKNRRVEIIANSAVVVGGK